MFLFPTENTEKKSVRIDIIIEKISEKNQNPGRDEIINCCYQLFYKKSAC